MELLGYGGLFASVGLTLSQLLKNYAILKRKYKELENASVQTPQQFVDEFRKDLSTISSEDSHSPLGMFYLHKNSVFLEGVISSSQPIKSTSDGSTDLLYSMSYQKDLYSRREFSDKVIFPPLLPENEKLTTKVAQGLFIKDYESDMVCNILKTTQLDFNRALEVVSMKPNLILRGVLQSFLRSIIDVVKMILALSYLKLNYLKKKGAYEGFMNVEMGLRLSSVVTIFGDLIYDVRNNRLVMENATFLLRDKQQFLDLIKSKLNIRRIIISLLAIPLVIGGSMFLKRLFEAMQLLFRAKKQRMIAIMRQKMEQLAQDKNLNDNQKCNICYSNLRNIILKPCLHMCLCHFCLKQLRKQECPICKHEITSSLEIFLK